MTKDLETKARTKLRHVAEVRNCGDQRHAILANQTCTRRERRVRCREAAEWGACLAHISTRCRGTALSSTTGRQAWRSKASLPSSSAASPSRATSPSRAVGCPTTRRRRRTLAAAPCLATWRPRSPLRRGSKVSASRRSEDRGTHGCSSPRWHPRCSRRRACAGQLWRPAYGWLSAS